MYRPFGYRRVTSRIPFPRGKAEQLLRTGRLTDDPLRHTPHCNPAVAALRGGQPSTAYADQLGVTLENCFGSLRGTLRAMRAHDDHLAGGGVQK